jgi:hypothetical protein
VPPCCRLTCLNRLNLGLPIQLNLVPMHKETGRLVWVGTCRDQGAESGLLCSALHICVTDVPPTCMMDEVAKLPSQHVRRALWRCITVAMSAEMTKTTTYQIQLLSQHRLFQIVVATLIVALWGTEGQTKGAQRGEGRYCQCYGNPRYTKQYCPTRHQGSGMWHATMHATCEGDGMMLSLPCHSSYADQQDTPADRQPNRDMCRCLATMVT